MRFISHKFSLFFNLSGIIVFYQIKSLPDGESMDIYDKWLTIDDLANYIKMSRTKLYGMAQRGQIPASKIGSQWRFDREEIDRWMKAHETDKDPSTPENRP